MNFPIEALIAKPLPDFPFGNVLRVHNCINIPPTIDYNILKLTIVKATREVPVEVKEGEDPRTETEEYDVPDYREMCAGRVQMTPEQWDKWTTQSDAFYLLTTVAGLVGVEIKY